MGYILGVDEAGRGPLAGPLTVGFIKAPNDFDILKAFPGINDSKQLTPKKREVLFALLEQQTEVAFHIEWISAADIDAHGLTKTVRDAVARGVRALMPEPRGHIYLDGLLAAPPEYAQETVTGGDGIVPAIMLASVAAKVARDKHMSEIDALYPEYGFGKHKGYGTKAHYEALRAHGPCREHRRLFLRKMG